jgi:hypothetical protein
MLSSFDLPFAMHSAVLCKRAACDRILVTTPDANIAQFFRQPSSFAPATHPDRIRDGFSAGIRSVMQFHVRRNGIYHVVAETSVAKEAQVDSGLTRCRGCKLKVG